MKAQIMLKFLFYAILGLVIFLPAVLWASKLLKIGDRALGSYNTMLEMIYEVRDGELLSMPLYMDDNSAIIGISKNSKRFEAKSRLKQTESTTYFEKNDPKCEEKACACLCRGISYESINVLEGKIKCKETICHSLAQTDFLKVRPLTDFSAPQPYAKLATYDYWWENGFIIVAQTDNLILAKVGFGGLKNEMVQKLKTIYMERYKNYVNVCYSRNCITSEVRNQIDPNVAIDSFKAFTKAYDECKSKKDGNCGSFNLNMPALHYIYYRDSKNGPNGFYLMRYNYPSEFNEDNIVKNIDGAQAFHPGQLFKDESIEFSTGNIFEGYESELSVKDSKIILKITTKFE